MIKTIYDITPFSLLDYPGKVAAILWFAGCNMRCAYCYNPEIVLGKGRHTFEEALDFLETRKALLDAVVLSGGECTLHKDLPVFVTAVKQKGFLVKIDTNGTHPELLELLIGRGLADYVAVDFKAPANKYGIVTGTPYYDSFIRTLQVLVNSSLPFEVRTTVHSSLLQQGDIEQMCQVLKEQNYTGNYYLQYALNNVAMLEELPDSVGRVQMDASRSISGVPIVERSL
ncbi:anaerobic ribonucleoside-triphosphate reductase activating protein [Niabella aquatica]